MKGTEIALAWGRLGPGPGPEELLRRCERFSRETGLSVQLVDARALTSEDHLRSAVLHALRARDRGRGRASTLGMEVLLHVAGNRQIREALKVAGIAPDTEAVAVMIVGEGARRRAADLLSLLGAERGGPELAGGREALRRLGLDPRGARGNALDLALEQVALLDLEK